MTPIFTDKYFKKKWVIKWESILKMGSLGESKMWKIKRGHSVTSGLKMGVNVTTHTRHIFSGNAPPPGVELTTHRKKCRSSHNAALCHVMFNSTLSAFSYDLALHVSKFNSECIVKSVDFDWIFVKIGQNIGNFSQHGGMIRPTFPLVKYWRGLIPPSSGIVMDGRSLARLNRNQISCW